MKNLYDKLRGEKSKLQNNVYSFRQVHVHVYMCMYVCVCQKITERTHESYFCKSPISPPPKLWQNILHVSLCPRRDFPNLPFIDRDHLSVHTSDLPLPTQCVILFYFFPCSKCFVEREDFLGCLVHHTARNGNDL